MNPPRPPFESPRDPALRAWSESLVGESATGRSRARERFEERMAREGATPAVAGALAGAVAISRRRRRGELLRTLRSLLEHAGRDEADELVRAALARDDLIPWFGGATDAEADSLRHVFLWSGWEPLDERHMPALLRALGESESAAVRLSVLRCAEHVVATNVEWSEGRFFAHLERRIAVDPSREVRREATSILHRLGGIPDRGEPHLPWAAPELPPIREALCAWIDALRSGYGEPEDRFADAIDARPGSLPPWVLDAIPQVCALLADARRVERCLVVLDRLAEAAMHASRDDPRSRRAVESAFRPIHGLLARLVASDSWSESGLASLLLQKLAPRTQPVVDALVSRIRRDARLAEADVDMECRIRTAASILASEKSLDRRAFLDVVRSVLRTNRRPRILGVAARACLLVNGGPEADDASKWILDLLGSNDGHIALEAAREASGFANLDEAPRSRAFLAALARVRHPVPAQVVAEAALCAFPATDPGRRALILALRDCDAFWADGRSRPAATARRRAELLKAHGLPHDRAEFASRALRLGER